MSNFLRKVFKRLTTSKSRPSYFLCPPQLTSLETRINPTPITVNTLQDTSATDAFISLREAIDLANINSGADTIVFASSLFTNGPATISLTGVLPAIADATSAGTLTITGPGANTLNISGNNGNFSVFSVASLGNLTISGVTVSGANNSGFGGAFNNLGSLFISASTITGNSATGGGGIFNQGTALTIFDSTISGNSTSGFGGGINNFNGGTISVSNSTISNNSATNGGGGIINTNSNLTISNSTLFGNTTPSVGGGILNTTVNSGTSILSITNSTLSGNSAGNSNGGGIRNYATINNLSDTIIANSIKGGDFVGNAPTVSSNNNLITTGSLTGATTVTGAQINLGPLQDNGGPTFTMALGAGSVAIGTTAGTSTDQRGINRTTNDIGAYSFGIQVTSTADSGTGSLRTAIDLANITADNDQISVNMTGANPYTITLATPLSINAANIPITGGTAGTVTITGLGASNLNISGNNGNFSIFSIASLGNLFISGVTVSGANTSGNGGAFNNLGTLTVTNSAILGNSATNNGGGIHNSGTLTVSNSTISGNTAGSFGGGIYNNGNLTVSNSTLSGNTANNGGGIFNLGGLIVTNSTLSGNSANQGGGIFNSTGATLTVFNSTLSGNSASQGGGIFNETSGTLTISNSTLSGNTASTLGGGLYNNGTGTLTNSTLSGNSASFGGGIKNQSNTLTVINTTISGNSATNSGGGISNYSILNISNTIIANSTSGGDFAGTAPNTNTNNLVEDGKVSGTTYAWTVTGDPLLGPLQDNGGPTFTMALLAGSPAIGSTAGTGTDQRGINRTTNDIGAYSFGIAVNTNSDATATDSVTSLREAITQANNTPGNDGISFNLTGSNTITLASAVLPTIAKASSAGSVIINGLGASALTISGNSGDFNFFNIATGGNLFISGVTVSGAVFTSGNGGAFNNLGSLAISASTITGNSALNGGAIINQGTSLIVKNSIISNNTTAGYGGGINNYNAGTISISNSTISGNSATKDGGGIINTNSNLTITDSVFTGNLSTTKYGAGILNANANSFLTVSGSTFSNNTATKGGAIFNNGTANINSSTISGNISAVKGAGIYNDITGVLTITDSTISNNASTGNGGGVFNKGSSLNISKSTISGNTSAANGGGVSNNSAGPVTISYSMISSNSAASGAGIYNNNSRLNISNSTISGNSGTGYGGGLNNFNCNANTIAISSSTISNNSANLGGGGIINTNSSLSVSNSTIYGNTTLGNGGGILNFSGSSTLSVTNSTLSGNSALSGGGIQNNATINNLASTIIANSTSGGDFVGNAPSAYTNNLVETLGTVTGTFIPTYTADPLLGPLQNNGGPTFTMALGAGSPAIGTAAGTGTDQRGINRTANDIGAYSFGIAVTNTTDNSTSPSVGSLRYAIDLANNTPGNDQISVNLTGANFYTITLAGALPNIVTASTNITGGTAGTVTINGLGASNLNISGNNGDFSIFSIDAGGELTISGVTVSGANTSGNGGAFNNSGTLNISNSNLSGNTASRGAGIWNFGILTLSNSTLSGNTAASFGFGSGLGGAIVNAYGGTLNIFNSTLSGNTAIFGGGILNGGALTLTNSTLSGNSATSGGAILNDGNGTLTNSTLSGNTATSGGGGICNIGGTLTVTNSTLSGNSATINGGGGIYNSLPGTLNISNTIIANSISGGDYAGSGSVSLISPATSASNLITQTGSLVSAWATPTTSALLKLGLLQNNGGPTFTMALGAGSAAIGAGNSTISNAAPINGLDQRGFTRTTSDIGSYAYIAPSAVNDVFVAVNTSGQVGLFLSSAGTAITDFHTTYNSGANTLTITAATSGTLLTAPAAGIAGIIINGSTDTITLDLNTLANFAGLVIVGNSGLDSVTIGAGGVDLSAVTTGSANQSFTANILGTSNSTSALVLTNAIKTKGTAATYLSAGTIDGSGLITTPSITLLANTGIGNTTALSLASQAIAADSSTGEIVINNASASAVTVSSLTTKETTSGLGQLKIIQFAQTGGGDVTFSNVSTVGTAAGSGSGEIELSNAGNLIVGAGDVVSDGVSNIYIQTTNLGNIVLNGNVDASRGDGAISVKSAGSISGTGALISGLNNGRLDDLTAGTGIDVKTQGLDFSNANISTTTGDIIIENTTSINLPTIAAPANLSIKAGGTITQRPDDPQNNLFFAITVAGTSSFNAVNGAIALINAGNNFSGAVSLTNTGANNVAIVDIDDITIDVTILGTGTFAVTGTNIKLNNNVTTTNNSQTYTGNVVVNANNNGLPVTLSAGSGAIGISGNLDSAAGQNYSITLTSTGDVTIGGTIGGTQALGALLITGNDISLGNIGGANVGTTSNVSVQASDLISDTASITLTGTTYNTTGQQFYNSSAVAGNFDGTRPITLSGGSAGSTINMTTAGVSSNNAAEFTGLLDLNGLNLSINTTNNNVTTGGDITFNQNVNGAGTLTLNAGSTGNIIASGTIGATTPLTGVTITNAASGSFTGSIHAGNLTITDTTDAGIVNFQGDLTVTTGMTIAANGSYNVQMIGASNTIAGVTTFGNSGSLTFGDGGTDTFNFTGGIIATDPSAINLKGTITAAGTGVITLGDSDTSINIKNGNGAVGGASTGTITLGNAILEDNVTLTVGTGIANTINMAAVTGTALGTSSNLTINTTGAVTVAGAVGTDIGTVTITNSGGTTFQSTVAAATTMVTNTTGTVAFQGNLTLSTALVTTAQGYNVSITGTINNIAGVTSFLNTGTVTLGNEANDSTTFAGGLVITDPSAIAIQGTVVTTNTTMTLGDADTGITNNGTFGNPAILNAGVGIINLAGNVTGNGSNNPLKVITSGAGFTTVSGVNTAELQFSSGVVTIANPSDQTGGYRVLGGILQGGSMAKVGYIYAQTGTSTLAPGINGPGMMHTNSLYLSSGNTLQIDLQGTNPATGYDQIVVCTSGNVNLASATLALTSTFTPASGTVFTIVDNQGSASIIGTFNNLAEGAFISLNGSTYQISYVGGTGSNDVTLTVYNPATVTSFSPTIGKTGTPVVITGSNFTNVSQVSFNGTTQPTYTINSQTQITTTVPSGATTGTISITTIAGTATSTTSFTVDNTAPTLSISANPGSLQANETSTITFTFSEVVTGFSSSIITVTNGTITNPIASSSTVYTSIFTPTLGIKADGTISVSNNYFDSVGNQGTAATLTPPIAINTIQTPLVTGSASTTQGGSSVVSLVDPDTGAIIGSAVPFPGFPGEIRVVSGDFNNDGKVDIIAAAGPGGGPAIAILDSQTGEVLQSFFAFDPAFTGGVFIAVRDFNGDGILDIIVGAGAGGGPAVSVFDGRNLSVIKSFFAYAQDFTGGVSVASIDFNNDGIQDLVTGAGAGGAPHVKVFDGATSSILSQWYAYPASFTGGVFVAAGDIGNDGNIEVVTGAGSGGAPVVAVWDPYTGALLSQFMAYAEDFTGGVRVGVSDGNFDGILDLVTGAGPGGGPQVNGFSFPTLDLLFSFFSGDPANTSGVFVS